MTLRYPDSAAGDLAAHPVVRVKCTCCGALFDGFAPGQAEGCAAEVCGHLVSGAPGSHHLPAGRAWFFPEAQHGFEDGPLCDACLDSFRQAGALRFRSFS